MHQPPHATRSIAVIGSGISGLAAAYALSGNSRVTIFEADARLGGHAHTHAVDAVDGRVIGVDSAFLVYNERTYPTLCRLFGELGVTGNDTEMSMSVRNDATGLEYAGSLGIGGLFASPRAFRSNHLRMLVEIKRFHRAAVTLLQQSDPDDVESLAAFLARQGFSGYFVTNFITPLVAAVWSCPDDDALNYPARSLFAFLQHHGMLSVFGSPRWRTVAGGSATYVDRIAARLDEVLTDSQVYSLRRVQDGVLVESWGRGRRLFDAAVVAVHPDQALRLLDQPTAQERRVLGSISYSTNHAQLHSDESILPRRRRARASWNYRIASGRPGVLVTYDVSRLMRIAADRRYLVTLGGADLIDPESVIAEMTYQHPLFTPESVAAQRLLPTLDDDRIAYAGAYHGWGFHEDGAASGVRAARRLGADWEETPHSAGVCAC